MPDINKYDMTMVVGFGFNDTISKNCCIVDQAKVVEIDDSSGIDNSLTLYNLYSKPKPSWDRDDDIYNTSFEFVGDDVS
jgi:hypothetical protein